MSMGTIKDMLAQGTITQEYYYCAEGGTQWHPVGNLIYNRAPSPLPQLTKPNNQLVWSILVTFFCCLPLGIYSIIKSTSEDGLWGQGRYAEALKAANSAKQCNQICLCLGIIYIVLQVLSLCVLHVH